MESGTLSNWRKSSYSSGGANCVEVAIAHDNMVGVRDSKDPGPILTFTPTEWRSFTRGVLDSQFDGDLR